MEFLYAFFIIGIIFLAIWLSVRNDRPIHRPHATYTKRVEPNSGVLTYPRKDNPNNNLYYRQYRRYRGTMATPTAKSADQVKH